MPLDSNGFIGNIDLDPADISLTRRNWLSLGEALKQEREANFWDKRARLSVQLWRNISMNADRIILVNVCFSLSNKTLPA